MGKRKVTDKPLRLSGTNHARSDIAKSDASSTITHTGCHDFSIHASATATTLGPPILTLAIVPLMTSTDDVGSSAGPATQ